MKITEALSYIYDKISSYSYGSSVHNVQNDELNTQNYKTIDELSIPNYGSIYNRYYNIINIMSNSQRMIYYYAGLSTFKEKDYVLAISFFERMPDKGPKWLFYSKNSKLGSLWKQLVKYEKAYQCFELIYKDKKLANSYRASSLWEMANLRYLQKNLQYVLAY